MLRFGHDEAAARAAQGFVGGAGNEVCDAYRVRVDARSDEAGIMRHVHKQVRTDAVGDRAEALPVDHQCVGRSAGDDHLGLVFLGQFFNRVVINFFFFIEAIGNRVVQLAADIDRRAVGQVAAMRQRHAENGVARLEHGHVDGLIGLRTGVRLHVGVFRTKQRLQAVNRKLLGLVHKLAAAVVALAGITFRILVGKLAALRFHHRGAGVVLGGDQLDVIFLTAIFILNHSP